MAWKGQQSEPIDYISLLSVLINSKIQQTNPPLYQVISELLRRLNDNKKAVDTAIEELEVQTTTIGDTIINISGITGDASFITVNDETISLPNSVQLLAGTGINFDDSVPNKRTIIATGGTGGGSGGVLPMVNGEEPPQLLSNGVGDLVIIPYTYTP